MKTLILVALFVSSALAIIGAVAWLHGFKDLGEKLILMTVPTLVGAVAAAYQSGKDKYTFETPPGSQNVLVIVSAEDPALEKGILQKLISEGRSESGSS